MTTPVPADRSGPAWNAAKRLPSAASSTSSSCDTAAPAIGAMGGSESRSKHMAGTLARVAKRGSDAGDGAGQRPADRLPLRRGGRRVAPGAQQLGLDGVHRIDIGIAKLDAALHGRVAVEQALALHGVQQGIARRLVLVLDQAVELSAFRQVAAEVEVE